MTTIILTFKDVLIQQPWIMLVLLLVFVSATGALLAMVWKLAISRVKAHEEAGRLQILNAREASNQTASIMSEALRRVDESVTTGYRDLRGSIDRLNETMDDIAGTLHEKINQTNERIGTVERRAHDRIGKVEKELGEICKICDHCEKTCPYRNGKKAMGE